MEHFFFYGSFFLWSKCTEIYWKVKDITGYIEKYLPRLRGVDRGFGSFCKGSWADHFLLWVSGTMMFNLQN